MPPKSKKKPSAASKTTATSPKKRTTRAIAAAGKTKAAPKAKTPPPEPSPEPEEFDPRTLVKVEKHDRARLQQIAIMARNLANFVEVEHSARKRDDFYEDLLDPTREIENALNRLLREGKMMIVLDLSEEEPSLKRRRAAVEDDEETESPTKKKGRKGGK